MHDSAGPPDGDGSRRAPRPRSLAELEAEITALIVERG